MSRYSSHFYHCFPQWLGTSDIDELPGKKAALITLRLMFRWGLLLTPEKIEFPGEPFRDADRKPPVRIKQNRICFTELAEHEVPDHANAFGPIALEFGQRTLRKLGAMPVFYIPQAYSENPEEDGLALVGQTFVYRLFETYQILSDLVEIEKEIRDLPRSKLVTLSHKELSESFHIHAQSLNDFFDYLTQGRQPLCEQASAINVLSCLFYPTDAKTTPRICAGDTRLAYYREREWRILGNVLFANHPQDQRIPEEAANEIAAFVNNSYSPYEKKCIDGSKFVRHCNILAELDNIPVISHVRRILVPYSLKCDVQKLADEYGFEGSITSY